MSEPVSFVSEWRYYVVGGVVKGFGRYDPDGADDAPLPDTNIVADAVLAMSAAGANLTYGLDFGVLDTGETVLVECNDAYALGLYGKALSSKDYMNMLKVRWDQISQNKVVVRKFKP